jgi:hypothetical protein
MSRSKFRSVAACIALGAWSAACEPTLPDDLPTLIAKQMSSAQTNQTHRAERALDIQAFEPVAARSGSRSK